MLLQRAKTFRLTLYRHQSNTKMWDQYLINVNLTFFFYWRSKDLHKLNREYQHEYNQYLWSQISLLLSGLIMHCVMNCAINIIDVTIHYTIHYETWHHIITTTQVQQVGHRVDCEDLIHDCLLLFNLWASSSIYGLTMACKKLNKLSIIVRSYQCPHRSIILVLFPEFLSNKGTTKWHLKAALPLAERSHQ